MATPDLGPTGWLAVAIAGAAVAALAVLVMANLSQAEKRIQRRIARLYPSTDPSFTRALSVLFGPSVLAGNRVDTLVNGDRIFPAMLEAIASARTSITFETFIYWSGEIGDASSPRRSPSGRGPASRCTCCSTGSARSRSTPTCSSASRRPASSWSATTRRAGAHLTRLNNRTHRKLLVVDGRIGFTGGVGIADDWNGDADAPDHWRDTHYRVEGPVVAQMQAAFLDNWIKARGELLHGERYFPPLAPAGDGPAQVFVSSPSGGSESMHLMVNYALGRARAARSGSRPRTSCPTR